MEEPLLSEEHLSHADNTDTNSTQRLRTTASYSLKALAVLGVCCVCAFVLVTLFASKHTTNATSALARDSRANGVSLTVSTNTAVTNTWVTVSWDGVSEDALTHGSGDYICTQDSYCKTVMEMNLWVGLFGENDDISQIGPQSWPCANPPWLATAPVKWKPLNSTSGDVTFHLESNLENVRFHLFANGSTFPILLASSEVITFRDLNRPFAVHLARTKKSTEMRVMWQSKLLSSTAMVRWGYESQNYQTNTSAIPSTYTKTDLCGPPATTHGWKDPGYFYTAVLEGLEAGAEVFYVVGSADSGGWTAETSFRAASPSAADQILRITATADVGETYIDGAQYHWMEPYAINTTNGMIHAWDNPVGTEEMRRLAMNPHNLPGTASGRTGPPSGHTFSRLGQQIQAKGLDQTDLVLHIGDISYATGYESEWDRFMRQIEPIASRVPYMTGQGNHERDYPGSGDAFGGGDSGGECGLPTEARFIMPTPVKHQDSAWYSFDQGPVHFVMMDTEIAWGPGSTQYAFLESDLAAVDRSVTPWVFFMGHRPMYYSNILDPMFAVLEPLLYRYRVDLCLWGHQHNAQQTCPVYNATCVTEPSSDGYLAPIHVVIGNGGQSLNDFPKPRAAWSLYEAVEFGFSTIEVVGNKTLEMKFFADLDGALHHTFQITKGNRI